MIINCSSCKGPVIVDLKLETASPSVQIKAMLRCPHCKKPVDVRIETGVKIEIWVNGRPQGQDDEGPRARVL